MLQEFSKEGLLFNIRTDGFGRPQDLEGGQDEICYSGISLRGTDLAFGGDIRDDKTGNDLAEAIVKAAHAQNIPVVLFPGQHDNLSVSPHVREAEKAPEILLKALGAYAVEKGHPDLAQRAKDAADRMTSMVAELSVPERG